MKHGQAGTTLIELVVAIVIITMAAGTIIGLIATMSRGSAEAMTHSQSVSIANAYMQQILSESYANVMSYDGRTDLGARDHLGNVIANTGDYRIDVFVTGAALGGISGAQSRRVQVRVTDPMGEQVWLTGFKTNH